MARKSADMILLLGSRGQYRGRKSSFLSSLGASLSGLFGRATAGRSSLRGSRASSSTPSRAGNLVLLAVLLVGFAGGFFVRGHFAAAAPADGSAGLQATPRSPSIVGEIDAAPLANEAFIVSAYPGLPAPEAQQRAKELAEWLRGQELRRARPFEYQAQSGPLWVVAVYFDGEAEKAATAERLRGLPQEVPDTMFAHFRKSDSDWPKPLTIR